MWLLFALLAAIGYATVHILDEYCVGDVFEKPWFGVVTSSFTSLIVFQTIPFVAPFVSWSIPSTSLILMAFFAGVLFQCSQYFYFYALSYSEAGIIAAYWNLIPMMLPIASFIVFGKVFGIPEYLGITILIASSVGMCLVDSNLKTKWLAFFLIFIGSILQVTGYLIEDIVFDHAPLYLSFLTFSAGLICAGISPLLFRKFRKSFLRHWKKLATLLRFFLVIEAINLVAIVLGQKSIALGEPSMVAAIETTIPIHVFVINLILLKFFKRGNTASLHKINFKVSFVAFMILGVWLIA